VPTWNVAAVFDDVTGFVIGRLRNRLYRELTVRYLAGVRLTNRWKFGHDLTGENAANSSSARTTHR